MDLPEDSPPPTWRQTMDHAKSSFSLRLARLRELEAEISRKDVALRRLTSNNGGSSFPWSSKIVVGVCAMNKKATCKPMREILSKLPSGEFEIRIFEERVILEDPIECWPICDCLIAFYSSGFPLDKAEAYAKLRRPFLVNDLESQRLLWDRRNVYKLCEDNDIPVPPHIVVNRGGKDGDDELIEGDDFVEVRGRRINKPFVEKPVDADCHDVFVYYPRSSGGGRKELFRKVDDRSSEFYPDRDTVRRSGSYIYEEFLITEGTDVKVYACTGDYAHAEARKSPVMDGRVMRDENNVEVRYPVILSNFEKELARRVVVGFKQRVCGFDMLRSGGKSYVCDVNGWSFVKRSARYHKDSALMLARLMRKEMGRMSPADESESDSDGDDDDDNTPLELRHAGSTFSIGPNGQPINDVPKRHEELRAVIAVIRHGDRTPKQKLKMTVTDPRYLNLFVKYGGGKHSQELKLKTAKELGDVLEITNEILSEIQGRSATPLSFHPASDEEEDVLQSVETLSQTRAVLEMHGTFRGINRKVQLRVTQTHPQTSLPVEAQLIVKWGGVLTPQGRERADELGRSFRLKMYPGEDGLMRLHSTYRHDLKIYASDEGRVQVTAAAFAKGLLDLEGHLTPILESLVKKGGDINMLLHDASRALPVVVQAKAKLKSLLTSSNRVDYLTALARLPVSVQNALKSLERSVGSVPENSSQDECFNEADSPMMPVMKKLHEEIAGLASQLKMYLRSSRAGGGLGPARGSVTAAAFRALRKTKTKRMASSEDLAATPVSGVAPTPTSSEPMAIPTSSSDGGSAAASIGFDLDSKTEKVDRGDGAITVRDMFTLAHARWEKLQLDFFKKGSYDISKIPDIYDCAKYDVTHNPEMLALSPSYLLRVYDLSKHLADAVVPQEYGETPQEKFEVGAKTCSSLLGKIREDLRLAAEEGQSEKSISAAAAAAPSPTAGCCSSEAMPFEGASDVGSLTGSNSAADDYGEGTSHRLDRRLAKSMGIKNTNRHVRTRLYFTSESHLHAIMNVLRFAHQVDASLPKPSEHTLTRLAKDVEEISYLSHVVIRLYEVTEVNGDKHHVVRIYFSDGIHFEVVRDEDGKLVAKVDPVATSANSLPSSMTHHHQQQSSLNGSDFGFLTHGESSAGSKLLVVASGLPPPIMTVGSLPTGSSSSMANLQPGSPALGNKIRANSIAFNSHHHNKQLLPANPLIPLWTALSLKDAMSLFDPNLSECAAFYRATSPLMSSPTAHGGAHGNSVSTRVPLHRFSSMVQPYLQTPIRPYTSQIEDEDLSVV